MTPLVLIGYWASDKSPGWPDPARLVDLSWDKHERNVVADYLGCGFVAHACVGYAPCRLCDRAHNGNLELSDGVYVWPEGLRHYVVEHGVRLPQQFVDQVWAATDALEQRPTDDTWWRSIGAR